MDLQVNDIAELKKEHPCGSKRWQVLRVGMDIKLRSMGCGHEVMQPRRKVERMIRRIVPKEETEGDRNGRDIWPWALRCCWLL